MTEPLEAPKHEHERSTDGDEAKVREYGKLVLFITKHSRIFLAAAGMGWSVYTTIQALKAEVSLVKADVAAVKTDVADVKKDVSSTKSMVSDMDKKLDRMNRRGGRDLYGSAK